MSLIGDRSKSLPNKQSMTINRRNVLKYLTGATFLGGFWSSGRGGLKGGNAPDPQNRKDYFQELGIPVLVNAVGTVTTMTGGLMEPAVMDAINSTSNHFVSLNELNEKVGERIAELLRCEAALVSAGAASAIQLGTAATITGTDRDRIRQLPNLPGPRPEVIIQKSHRLSFDQMVTNCGVRLVEVETARDLERAVNKNTVMLFFFNRNAFEGRIQHEEFVALGKKHGIPTFNDCAAELPPVDNLWRFTEMGFDLVAFSGGKELRGPQSAGLLLGRKDLIEAARLNHSPYGAIGRGMKVNKEEIVGMLAALEYYLQKDHEKEFQERLHRVKYVGDAISGIPGIRQEIRMNRNGFVGEINIPVLHVSWDPGKIRKSVTEVRLALRRGHPPIAAGGGSESLAVNLRQERMGTERIVARRLHEELTS